MRKAHIRGPITGFPRWSAAVTLAATLLILDLVSGPSSATAQAAAFTCDESLGFGRVARDGNNDRDPCVLLDSVIVIVADGYTVDYAAAELEKLQGWTVTNRLYQVGMITAKYSPDNLTLGELKTKIGQIEDKVWAETVEPDAVAWTAGSDQSSEGQQPENGPPPGAESVREAEDERVVKDSPSPGETVQQPATVPKGFLENPSHNSYQSGISVLSGWVCEAAVISLVIDDMDPQRVAYGTERIDTAHECGDTDNGFGLLFNWNSLGDGTHTVVALADGVEFDRATFTVTTLGEEFVRGIKGEYVVKDFPSPGETVLLEWQQSQQNFVIKAVE